MTGGGVAGDDVEEAGEGAVGKAAAGALVGVGAVGEEVGGEGGEDLLIAPASWVAGVEAGGVDEGVETVGVAGGGDGAGSGFFDGGDNFRDAGAVEGGDGNKKELFGGEGAEDGFVVADEVGENARGVSRDEVEDEGAGQAFAGEGHREAALGDVVGQDGVVREVLGDDAGKCMRPRAVGEKEVTEPVVGPVEMVKMKDGRANLGEVQVGFVHEWATGNEKIDGIDDVVVHFVEPLQ